jgi:hypothetical protein
MNSVAPASGPSVVQELPLKNSAEKNSKPKPKSKPQREIRPSKILPTERLTVERQLEILRAYAAASSHGSKAVTLEEVAGVVEMAPTTVSLANAFLASVGFISKTDSGFMPAPEVVSFLRAHEWNPESSSQKLSPVVEKSWFFQAIKPRLSFNATPEDAVIDKLAEAATAPPEYKRNLQMLIEFAVAAGLLQRDGNQLKLTKPSTASPDSTQRGEGASNGKSSEIAATDSQTKSKMVTTAFAKTAEGAVHFNVSVRVDMEEFAGWEPGRISAFFSGIAEVLKAKAGIEVESGS